MISTTSKALNWVIGKAHIVENGSLTFQGTLNSRMAQEIKHWFDNNGATLRDGRNQTARNLHHNGYSLSLKSGNHRRDENNLTLWIEKIEIDPDQAEFVNWWVC